MIMETLLKRRSVRDFQDRPVEKEKVTRILKTALSAPSGKGLRPRQYVYVDSRTLLEKLAGSKPSGSAFLAGAAFGIVVCADPRQASAWVEDCAIAGILMQIAIEEEGLSSCWVQIRERRSPDGGMASDYIREILKIPEGYEVETIIGGGYARNRPPAGSDGSLEVHKLHHNRFSDSYNL